MALISLMITPKNLIYHELIGLLVRVVQGPAQGLDGRVVDESRNMFTIEAHGKEKIVVKEQGVFVFTLPSGERVRVEGRILVARPEDRIKKKQKKWT